MRPISFEQVSDVKRFGGKTVSLGAALRAGFPVPPGMGISIDLVEAIARGGDYFALLKETLSAVGPRVAVRSSAVGEDSNRASFAGQHDTLLNVTSVEGLAASIKQIWQSGRRETALAYRSRLGLSREPKVAVAVQHMINPSCAGVLFTRDPMSRRDVRIIEATWGLGEAVVGGLVTPDRFEMSRGGKILERIAGEKDLAIYPSEEGTIEREVKPEWVHTLCLDDDKLQQLEALATSLEGFFEGAHDIEWCFEDDKLYLLQRRPITR
jgi:pyruvate,water dikinase